VRVNSVMYFGDHLRLLCSAGAAQAESVVKLPLSTQAPPTAGALVWLELPAEFTRIYALS
jgi:putative spermidine/putrescine transport system ATP-binding protein